MGGAAAWGRSLFRVPVAYRIASVLLEDVAHQFGGGGEGAGLREGEGRGDLLFDLLLDAVTGGRLAAASGLRATRAGASEPSSRSAFSPQARAFSQMSGRPCRRA